MKYINIKNIFDRTLAFILIILFIPIFFVIGLIIFIDMGHPIFFSQRRPGYKNKIFKIYKFRTMKITFDIKTIIQTIKIPHETNGVRADSSRSKRGKKNILF